ncbi:MAG: hypothetical protein QM713_17065 [Arachnia sp.]
MSGSPGSPRRLGILRMLGVGALGLIGGALLALFIQDLLAVAFVQGANVPDALTIVLIHLIPVVSIVTAVAAVVIDRKLAVRRTSEDSDDD